VNQVTGVTDARVIEQDHRYYLFSTGPGIPIRESADLTHWTEIGQVFAAVPAWAQAKVPGATEFWAPDVSYFGGLYHVFYAVSTFGGQQSVFGLATNTTLDPSAPGYHWVDRGEVVESAPGVTDFNAIDPDLVIDPRSGVWLAFGSQWGGVKLVAIDPATGKPPASAGTTANGAVTLAARPGGGPIEAPFVFQRGGYYYLFVSFDACCMGSRSTYKIMVGRSTSVTGPYLARNGKPMAQGGATLVLAGNAHYRGPGHNSVFSDGTSDWLVYHAYDTRNGGTATLQIRPLSWSADGWPVPGQPMF
jgi:arabinan endo-1,5-alpha-L-arabinosidase